MRPLLAIITRSQHRPPKESLFVGVALIALAASVTVPMDAIVKHLTSSYNVFILLWARFFFHAAFLATVAAAIYGEQLLRPPQPGLQILRGLCLASASLFFFYSVKFLPLADTLALVFSSPLVLTAIAPFMLGEKVGVHRWGAVIVGFIGACIIIRPGFEGFTWYSLLPIATGACFALYLVLNRKLSNTAPTLISLAIMAIPGAIIFSAIMPVVWQTPLPQHIWMLPLIGLMGACGHFCYIRAYTKAPAVALAPFGYLELPLAVFFGWMVFNEFPDEVTWVGIGILVASGLYILHRERVIAKKNPTQTPLQ